MKSLHGCFTKIKFELRDPSVKSCCVTAGSFLIKRNNMYFLLSLVADRVDKRTALKYLKRRKV